MCSNVKKLIPIVTTEQTGLLIQGGDEREGLHIDNKVCGEWNSDELWYGNKDNGD